MNVLFNKITARNFYSYTSVVKAENACSLKNSPCDSVSFSANKPYSSNVHLDMMAAALTDQSGSDKERLNAVFNALLALSDNDKEKFIKAYSQRTGFPDVKKTSALIEQNVSNALIAAEKETGIKPLMAGYNPTCSVGIGTALPGSDLDTFFVCVPREDDKNKFMDAFKNNVDPLLCRVTYNRTDDVPDKISLKELMQSIMCSNKGFEKGGLAKYEKTYENILNEPQSDWLVAGKYSLDVNKYIPEDKKTLLLRAGFVMEILRDGIVFQNNFDNKTLTFIENSPIYKYSNLQQMRAYKNVPPKQKHVNRLKELAKFEEMPTSKKLDFIMESTKLSLKSTKKEAALFEKFIGDSSCGNMEDLMQPLLNPEHRRK